MLDAADTLETLGRSWAVQIESMAGEYAAQIRRRAQTLKPGAGVEFIE